jgi:hypothetical protein
VGQIVKDPNLRVQEAMALVFKQSHELGSIRQTHRWFHGYCQLKARSVRLRASKMPSTYTTDTDFIRQSSVTPSGFTIVSA